MKGVDEAIRARFARVSTWHVADAARYLGLRTSALTGRLRPLTPSARFAGPAVTRRYATNRTGHQPKGTAELVDSIEAGDVIVLDAQGRLDCAVWGEAPSIAAKRKGAAGVVLYGGARFPRSAIADELHLPVWGLGGSLPSSTGVLQGLAPNEDVVIEGVLIRARDWLVADDAGICVVPREMLERVADLAEERSQSEQSSLDALRRGSQLTEVPRAFEEEESRDTQRE